MDGVVVGFLDFETTALAEGRGGKGVNPRNFFENK
jgi:hypothetical protein